MQQRFLKLFFLLILVIFFQGCFLVNLPFQVVKQVFRTTSGVVGSALKLVGKAPLPPPGAF